MKRILLILLLATAPALTSCNTQTSERVVTVHTLKAVGQIAEDAVALSARLYADGKITAARAKAVMDVYDNRFQPAFRVAVQAAKFDLSQVSPQTLFDMATDIQKLVASFQ